MRLIKKGATSRSVHVFIRDSASTTGAGLAGLVFNTAGLTAYYTRPGAAETAIALATQTVIGAYASGGFVQIGAVNSAGLYRLDLPDAVLASGVDFVSVILRGAANMEPCALQIQLTVADLQDAVRLGLTGLANAAAGGAGGLPIVGAGANNFKSDASANVTFANVSIATIFLR